jgi:hypothetical protein
MTASATPLSEKTAIAGHVLLPNIEPRTVNDGFQPRRYSVKTGHRPSNAYVILIDCTLTDYDDNLIPVLPLLYHLFKLEPLVTLLSGRTHPNEKQYVILNVDPSYYLKYSHSNHLRRTPNAARKSIAAVLHAIASKTASVVRIALPPR